MIPTKVFEALIEAAIAAPSPDNNQPWQFRISDDRLQVYLDKGRSLPSDVKSMFDMTSIGAAIENAVIAAAELGYTAEVHWKGENPTAEIALSEGGSKDPLFPSLHTRCTNRKMYASQPLDAAVLKSLSASCSGFADVQIDWLSSTDEKRRFGKLIASTDSLRFQHQPFHEELFRQLRFTKQEAETTADGLDVRTLELPPGLSLALPVLRSWKVMRTLIALKMLPLLTMPSVVSVQKSGAIAVISVPKAFVEPPNDPAQIFLTGGRAIQRLWLAGAAADLAMHPLGSISIFLLQDNPKPEFVPTIELARKAVVDLIPSLAGRTIQLALRVGKSSPPTMRSIRRTADKVMS